MKKKTLLVPLVLLIVGSLIAGCAAPTPVPAPAPAPVKPVVTGRQLYVDKGCAVCHGQNAEGTDIAMALPGHNEEQIKRQVRNPLGSMPRSGPEEISNDELKMITDYIGSLSPVEEHIEPADMDEVLTIHHFLALNALESDNPDEAVHHISDILGLAVDAEHKAQMEDILEDIRAGEHHDASHTIEQVLVGKAKPELAMKDLHLQLALAAIGGEDSVDAKHHLNHYIDMVTGDEKARGEEVIELLEQGNFHDAEHEAEELLE